MIDIRPLPPLDILRRLPGLVEAKQRLTIDLMVYSHDVMVLALQRLKRDCETLNPAKLLSNDATALFADAWSIIDQIDLARQALNSLPGEPGPITTSFLDRAIVARALRNRMDHLPARIPNIASRIGPVEALFGTLSFVRCPAQTLSVAKIGDMINIEIITVSRGTVPGNEGSAKVTFNTCEVLTMVSNLRLTVGDASVALEAACAEFTDIINGFSESVGRSIDDDVPRVVLETGATEAEVRAPTPIQIAGSIRSRIPFGSE